LFTAAGVDLTRPVIASCGSGVTAGVLAFGLHLLGHRDISVYDGSWAEWGLPGDTPVETGPARG
jgi:thiosulfate/3-mercaptopyruvate sulfurtransferase